MSQTVQTTIGTLYECGQVKPHAEFFMCAALRREILDWFSGRADLPVQHALIKLAFPHMPEGGTIPKDQLEMVLMQVFDELTEKMIEVLPKDFPDPERLIAKFRSQKFNTTTN